jgi:hypothetical protein
MHAIIHPYFTYFCANIPVLNHIKTDILVSINLDTLVPILRLAVKRFDCVVLMCLCSNTIA